MSWLRVPHAPASAALVRHSMAAELGQTRSGRALSGDVLDAAALVVSELVGNAVRHGAALPGGGLVASWEVRDDGLRVEVVEGGSGPTGPLTHADPDAEGGRGLELVDALASAWGSTPAWPGTAVWAHLSSLPEPR